MKCADPLVVFGGHVFLMIWCFWRRDVDVDCGLDCGQDICRPQAFGLR